MMHYGHNGQNGMMQFQQNFEGMPQFTGGMGNPQCYHDNIIGNKRVYMDYSNYQQGGAFQAQQHMPQFSMMQGQPHFGDKSIGRARAQTRGPFSRNTASRSTTPTPMNRSINFNPREHMKNDELGMLRKPSEYSDMSKNPSISQIENNHFNGEHNGYVGQELHHVSISRGNAEQVHQMNIVNPDQIIVQKMSAPLEPTPTHVAKMNKMRLMGMAGNNNTPISQTTPTASGMKYNIKDNIQVSRQVSFPPQYYQEKYPPKSTKSSNNTAAAFNDSSPKVLGSYVSRQLEEEVARLRYLVDTQTKRISALEMRNKELENELMINRNYQQLYQDLLDRNNSNDYNTHNLESDSENNTEREIVDEGLNERLPEEPEETIQRQRTVVNDSKHTKQASEKGSTLFSNIHQFSAESALRKAGVPPGKPSYIYRPPSNAEMVDIKLAEFHNSRSSLIRWSKVSSTIYLFGTTQVQLRISRGSLLARPESSEWGNGNFWPIEKFVSVFEPIERAKMPNN
ncbi:hypothetical protein HWI79_1988 [Cryptosporidium felis]|nr:hypothetical protein HWI79_1988 [Cryptosporidium felis]